MTSEISQPFNDDAGRDVIAAYVLGSDAGRVDTAAEDLLQRNARTMWRHCAVLLRALDGAPRSSAMRRTRPEGCADLWKWQPQDLFDLLSILHGSQDEAVKDAIQLVRAKHAEADNEPVLSNTLDYLEVDWQAMGPETRVSLAVRAARAYSILMREILIRRECDERANS